MLLAVGPVDALLDARGSSKRWLASKLGMKESTLSRYLSGSRPAPPDLYQRIADVLHVPVAFVTPREPNGDTVAA
jgi:transcriptional regulator with XRE-family HTH domain